MRIATLALLFAAACHGGFFSVGGGGNLPSESAAGDLGWEASFTGAGYLNKPTGKVRVGLEGFGAYANNDLDHVYFGGGARLNFFQRDSGYWYFRGGLDYHNFQGIPAEGPGIYVGFGRAFWLDSEHRWSLAPEVRVHVWENFTDEVFVLIPPLAVFADLGTVVNTVAGIQLTYHFGGRKAAKKGQEKVDPNERYYH